MGMFLSMSGVVGRDEHAVTEALQAFAMETKQIFEPGDPSTNDHVMLIIHACKAGVVVVYPNHYLESTEATRYLSQRLNTPAFVFDIADGDLWMYELYDKEVVVDCFCTLPDYWGDIEETEWKKWQGSASNVARYVHGVSSERIENYLVHWCDANGNEIESKKAYPTDQFEYQNEWQLLDFMNALGFDYPVQKGGVILGSIHRLKPKRN